MAKRKLKTRSINTKVYGISNYQAAAQSVQVGDELTLGRQADNKYDSSAIGIVTKRGQLLGYINRDIAEDLSPKIDEGRLGGICFAQAVTGGGDRTTGVNLLLVVADISTPDAELYAMTSDELGMKLRKTEPPRPRKPILLPLFKLIGKLIGSIWKLIKRAVVSLADAMGMPPLLVATLIVGTLVIAIALVVLLSP